MKDIGLGIIGRPHMPITVVAVVALLCCALLAWSYGETRLAVLLMLGQGAFLLTTPSSLHLQPSYAQ